MILRICSLVVAIACGSVSASALASPLGYSAVLANAPGSGPDYLLPPSALKNVVLTGLRDSGLQVTDDWEGGGLAVQFDASTLFQPQLQRLRVVAGVLELHAFSNSQDRSLVHITCSQKIFAWRAAGVEAEMAQHIKDDLYQQAKNFAQTCRGQLNN